MKKKNIFLASLFAATFVLSLSGCSKSNDNGNSNNNQKEVVEEPLPVTKETFDTYFNVDTFDEYKAMNYTLDINITTNASATDHYYIKKVDKQIDIILETAEIKLFIEGDSSNNKNLSYNCYDYDNNNWRYNYSVSQTVGWCKGTYLLPNLDYSKFKYDKDNDMLLSSETVQLITEVDKIELTNIKVKFEDDIPTRISFDLETFNKLNREFIPDGQMQYDINIVDIGTSSFEDNLHQVILKKTEGGSVSNSSLKNEGEVFTVTAKPSEGYEFVGWYNKQNIRVTPNPSYTLTMVDSDIELEARFQLKGIQVTGNAETGGSVTGSGKYRPGDTVTLEAIPDAGYEFVGWYNGTKPIALDSTYSFTMGSDEVSVTAKFQLTDLNVNVTVAEGGIATGKGKYKMGDTVTLEATPLDSYVFTGWKIGNEFVSYLDKYTFTMPGEDLDIEAVFEYSPIPLYTLSVSATEGGTASGFGKYEEGEKVQLKATLSSDLYMFLGWYDNNDNPVSDKLQFEYTMPNKSVELTAKFEFIDYLVYEDDAKTIVSGVKSYISDSVYFPKSVTKVRNNAFKDVTINNFYYDGTFEDYFNIEFESNANPFNENTIFYLLDDNGTYTFLGKKYSKPEELIIPDSITKLNKHSILYCRSFKNLVISSSCTRFNQFSIRFTNFNNVYYKGTLEQYLKIITSTSTTPFSTTTSFFVQSDTGSYYYDGKYYSKPNNIVIPSSVKYVYAEKFRNLSQIKYVSMGDSVTEIGEYAFANCTSLETIVIGKNVTTITNYNALVDCTKLQRVYYMGSEESEMLKKLYVSYVSSTNNTRINANKIYYYSETIIDPNLHYWYYDSNGIIRITKA